MLNLTQTGWLVFYSIVNYISYSLWTLLNKEQFNEQEHSKQKDATPCPVFTTAIQMLIAGIIACAVRIFMFGTKNFFSPSSSPSSSYSQQSSFSSSSSSSSISTPISPTLTASSAVGGFRTVLMTQILPLGIARAIDIGCGNAALALVSVALQQILKSLLPIFVCILSLFVLKKNSSLPVWLSLIPIVLGSFLAALTPSHHHHHSHPSDSSSLASQQETTTTSAASVVESVSTFGVILALVSTFGRSLKAVLNSLLVTGSKKVLPLRPLEVLSFEAPTSGLLLLIASALGQIFTMILFPSSSSDSAGSNLRWHDPEGKLVGTTGGTGNEDSSNNNNNNNNSSSAGSFFCGIALSRYMFLNLLAGFLMFFNQLSYISVIKYSSALTCQVLMNLKMMILIIVSIFVFNTSLSGTNYFGMFLASCGVGLYALASSSSSSSSEKNEDVGSTSSYEKGGSGIRILVGENDTNSLTRRV